MTAVVSDIWEGVGSLFGRGEKGGIDPELARRQGELEKQQKAQLAQQQAQMERERINAMRGRFSGSGGVPTETPGSADMDAANLFSRITGRTE